MPTERVRRRSTARVRFDHGRPIATLGLAPFAGVLLTLTLLFAALRPPVTHALLVDLPTPYPPDHPGILSPVSNLLVVTGLGSVLWNGEEVSYSQLRLLLSASTTASPQPVLLFQPEADAPYASAHAVMGIVQHEGLVDRCFVLADTARYRRFERSFDSDEQMPPQTAACAFRYE